MDRDIKAQVIIISDSTGETAEIVMRASLSQFGLKEVEIQKYAHVEDSDQIIKIIDRYKDDNCLIAFTIILPELKETLKDEARKFNLPIIDLMGQAIETLSEYLGILPRLKPGAFREMDRTYYKRVEAIDHAVECDDGKNFRMLFSSDILLIGISRTCKTPVCMYLANYHGIKAGNLPLAPEVIPPQEIFTFNKSKIFGLILDPEELYKIRKQRLKTMHLDPENSSAQYAQISRIYEEINYSKDIMQKIGCQIIDVTNKSIEETASEILSKRGGI